MVYKVIGIMSGSSLDGIDIVYTELQEQAGRWQYEIQHAACIPYDKEWIDKLQQSVSLPAKEYLLLNSDYGQFIGKKINEFIAENNLHHNVNLICSHGHTTFHLPEKKMTHQLGDGAAIAAKTRLPVVSDLRSLDVAFGGQGAPIVPLGEKLLFGQFKYFLNIGGIANLSIHQPGRVIAFDVCAANRVLNMLANEKGLAYDDEGKMALQGRVNEDLLSELNKLEYYELAYPKSLANTFGTDLVYPLLQSSGISIEDSLRTYAEHISVQIKNSLRLFKGNALEHLFITGGGAFNTFLIEKLQSHLKEINFEIFIPDNDTVKYKEALIMGLLGALRWREQYTVFSSVTGARQNSIGGALWLGTEA